MPRITVHGGVSDRLRPEERDPGPGEQPEAPVAQEPAEPLAEPEQPEDEDEDEYGSWPFAALRAEAKERGLSAGGTAEELAARLREDDEQERGQQ